MTKKYMVKTILIFAFSLILNGLSAQNYVNIFDNAYLVTNHDSIKCFIKVQGTYYSKIEYRLQSDSEILIASSDTVNFIIRDYNIYGKIQIKNQSLIPRIICWGEIKYYEEIEYGAEEFIRGDAENGVSITNNWTTHYIENQDTLLKIPKRKLGKKIAFLFEDNDSIYKSITKMNKLNNNQLIKLIQEYNNYIQYQK